MIHNKTELSAAMKEAIRSVLPVCIIVFILCFFIFPIPNSILMVFTLASFLLILGMGLFTLGVKMAMTPIGESVGACLTKSRKLGFILFTSLIVGILITISEPDLQVLATQVPGVPNIVLICTVSLGVGIFLVIALLRILLRIKLSYLLIGFYLLIFILIGFIPKDFQTIAFDSGGVTTGPMTVPFIMAFGIGVSSIRTDKEAANDTFGLVALSSIGPILSVIILGFFNSTQSTYHTEVPLVIENSRELMLLFQSAFPNYLKEVCFALLPILLFFLFFQVKALHLPLRNVFSIIIGLFYSFIGLSLFLTSANVGFLPAGKYLGKTMASIEHNIMILPIGFLLGYFIVNAEPAVAILNQQVEEMTSGAISAKHMRLSLSIGVGCSISLAMLRILFQIPLLYFLLIGYAIALTLTFFIPPIFTSIAFDSGGVASGPMTATFLLGFSIGICESIGGNIASDAFGIVALVAMTPLITIQLLGLIYRIKTKKQISKPLSPSDDTKDDVIDL